MTGRRGKYNARRAVVNDIKFDSILEAEVYLRLLEGSKRLGYTLALQPEFELIPPATPYPGKHLKGHKYTADFGITAEGLDPQIVIDVKSEATRKSRDFSVNEKLMWMVHQLCITVIEEPVAAENLVEMLEGALCH